MSLAEGAQGLVDVLRLVEATERSVGAGGDRSEHTEGGGRERAREGDA